MYKILFTILIAVLVSAAACTEVTNQPAAVNNAAGPAKAANTKAVDSHGHEDDAPRITLADAKKDFDAGSAVIVDVRDEAAYRQEHIKGAINITSGTLDAKLNDIPKGKKITAYCS